MSSQLLREHSSRKDWPRDRWHNTIRIQCVVRRALARLRVTRLFKQAAAGRLALYKDADRTEAALRLQCWARQCIARRRTAEAKKQREDAMHSKTIVLSTPELFSIYELPEEWFHWDTALLTERRLCAIDVSAAKDDCDGWVVATSSQARVAEARIAYCSAAAWPAPESSIFRERAEKIFRAIDVRQRSVVDERYLIEIHDRFGAPVPTGVYGRGGSQEDAYRASWCRSMIRRILMDSGRCHEFTRKTRLQDPNGTAGDPLADVAPGALNLNFDEFCTFLMLLARQ